MSYTIHLKAPVCTHCKTAGKEPFDCPDPTYNLTPIFDFALTGEPLPNPDTAEAAVVLLGKRTDRRRGLRILDGAAAGVTLADINIAIDRMSDPALYEQFVKLEPSNKWGDLEGALSVMKTLRELAAEYPNNVWEIR